MQAYGPAFARIYNLRWGGFAKEVAPRIQSFYEMLRPGQPRCPILDLCCGAGHMALHFLQQGYRVVGLDLSEAMLIYARQNGSDFVASGQADFVQADAVRFSLGEAFGLVVSTFDALNHLESMDALRSCFASVCAVMEADGVFIFDLNTRAGLRRWNNITVDETDEVTIITRGIYDGHSDRAWTRISGFVRNPDGFYERFEETVFNTAFEMEEVKATLLETGWGDAYAARLQDLADPIAEPEKEGRVFFVATR